MFQDIPFNQQDAFDYALWFDDYDLMLEKHFYSNEEKRNQRKYSIENWINGSENDSNYNSPDNCLSPQSQTRTPQAQKIPPWKEEFTVIDSIINFDEYNGSDNQMFSNENEKSRKRSNQPLIQKAYSLVTNSHFDKNCPNQFQRRLVRQLKRNGKHKLIKKLNNDKFTIKKRNAKKSSKKHKETNLGKHINKSQSDVEENSQSDAEQKNKPNFTHQLFNEFFQQSSSSLAQIVDILDQKIIDEHIDTNKKIASSKKIKKLGKTQQKVMDKCIRQVYKEFHKCMKRKIIRKCKDRTYKCESFMDDEFRAKLDEISQTHKKVLEDIIVSYPAIKVVEQKQ